MFENLNKNLRRNLLNIPGARSKKKIIVFESDDWGSIRMPSRKVFEKIKKENLAPEEDPYLKYDTLASVDDFNALFETLKSVRDKNNNHPIITANAVMGNPDFEKIEQHNFESYFWEPFTTTWQKYPHCAGVETAWNYGQENEFLKFQCHGREHLNVDQWMLSLQKGDKLVRKAFNNQMISISSQPSSLKFNYMEGLDFFSISEKKNKKKVVTEALLEFKNYFGFDSKSFIANCYIWDESIEEVLANLGVLYLQGMANQVIPVLNKNTHSYHYKKHYLGQKNKFGQQYLVRNAFFEPSLMPYTEWVSDCLQRINIAFRWNKPAIIGIHRLNFIGSIHEENRTKNLKMFKQLLKEIIKRWPDVEFRSSDQVLNEMRDE
ncbi:hypothetical protein FFWV33_16710 [Flavobacterium faecale]|uniref:Polysaccharide (De)acetylase n=1 Tax=Flavobacterium faecale TaxID=1355330 RepID=A0A2S1LH36_9FLAO|nr:hypothetical protein [Flavobacterium faecale]AWG23047.1 hypothetical protein FFWV33_16710 [Flavobacterium faecale]